MTRLENKPLGEQKASDGCVFVWSELPSLSFLTRKKPFNNDKKAADPFHQPSNDQLVLGSALGDELLARTGASLEQLQLINCSGTNCCFWLPVILWPGHCGRPQSQMVGVKVQGEVVNLVVNILEVYGLKLTCVTSVPSQSQEERKGCLQNKSTKTVKRYRGVGPEGALAAVSAGRSRRAGVLAEVVVAGDRLSAEVAHEAAAAARHPVAALRLDEARRTLDALPHPSCRHTLLTAVDGQRGKRQKKRNSTSSIKARHNRAEKERCDSVQMSDELSPACLKDRVCSSGSC